jgi:hypothetical protein
MFTGLELETRSVWFAADSLVSGASQFTSAGSRTVGRCVNPMRSATTTIRVDAYGICNLQSNRDSRSVLLKDSIARDPLLY